MLSVESLDLFYGDAQALSGVTLDVPEGEIVAIVGANGAGKTSLIRAIAGMLKPAAGRVFYKGADITGLDSHRVCNLGVGQVAEGRQVFPTLTVRENLAMGGLLPRARARKTGNMERMLELFPRLRERLTQAAGTLS
ncbi:MAG: ATP-binding cassette domain-containing protein, partial [Gammaproteobacteria bacterium]|nr:ATP-binding cassette domain-containing protein [Gammaproteobacteria bacterium]